MARRLIYQTVSVEQAPGVLPSHSAPGHGKGVENVQTGRDVSLQDRHGSIPSTKDGEGSVEYFKYPSICN